MYTECIIRMTITMSFNSVIYTVVITIQLTAPIQNVQSELLHPEATTDPPGLHVFGETTTVTLGLNFSTAESVDELGQNLTSGLNICTPDLSNMSGAASLLWKLSSPVKVSLDRLQNLLDTDTVSDEQNKAASANLVQHRLVRRFIVSTPRQHAKEHELPSGGSTKKRKYDYRKDPPPYMWTFDPTRETIRLFPPGETNPFKWALAKFNTQEDVENYKRVREKNAARDDDIFARMKGPVPLRHPNGTRIGVKRKYSWMGDDIMSNETMYHRKIMREIEEFLLANESVSADESTLTPIPEEFTKRCRIRTRAKYHGWTYMTCAPGVSWSPDVYVNSPHSDIFYSDQFDQAGPDTVEEYYALPTPDYNDSIYHLPDDLSRIPDKPKYREIASRTPPRDLDVWNTIKSHYDSHELYNDISIITTKKKTRQRRNVRERWHQKHIKNAKDTWKSIEKQFKEQEKSIEVIQGEM